MQKIVVAGIGYVGLVTGVCFAEKGNHVTFVDIDKERVKSLQDGIIPIYENELDALIKKNVAQGKIDYTIDYKNAYKKAKYIFICVGTPENSDGSADLEYVLNVIKQIAETISRDCYVIVKSTVPIGTNDMLEKILSSNLKSKANVEIVSNPEFLAQGTAVKDALYPSRIVIGSDSKKAQKAIAKLYQNFDAPIVYTNRRNAEMIKYASNAFLALKITYMNDIANLCELMGTNVDEIVKGMSYDPRIGNLFLNPGCGYGGSCFSKDAKSLYRQAKKEGYDLSLVRSTIDVNHHQKTILLEKARKYFPTFKHVNVAILGLTFKPGTDDMRGAPSLSNIALLLEEGAYIKAYDPMGINNCKVIYPTEIEYCDSYEKALKDADVCFIFTEWPEFKKISKSVFKKLMKTPIVFDGRNLYILDTMEGIKYHSVGR